MMAELAEKVHKSGALLKPDGSQLRVLYALDTFPQLSESYINAEIMRMQSWGVGVEVWSKGDPASRGQCDVKVHRGNLSDTIAKRSPDVVHAHWTKSAVKYVRAAREMGVPMTVRGHWHFIPKQLAEIEAEDTILRLYMFPHLAKKYAGASPKIIPMLSCFHPEWVAPRVEKDRSMVVRTSACKKPKDLATFIRVASRLPDFRFVMILCSLGPNQHFRELEKLNSELGTPVELIPDITYQEVATYLSQAAIYLHTYNPEVSFGMPVSIAEAMAAGCTILARNVEGATEYVGDAGRLYGSEDEAVELIRATEQWSDDDWAQAEQKSRDRAFQHFDDRNVLAPLREAWRRIAVEQPVSRVRRNVSLFAKAGRWIGLRDPHI